jgi:hypothetical protein
MDEDIKRILSFGMNIGFQENLCNDFEIFQKFSLPCGITVYEMKLAIFV